jgi:two-component system nitrate/nitrite response regulator NarL
VRQVEAFRRLHGEARIIAVTRAMRMADMALLFRAGANACFAEDVPLPIFLKSLELVMLGETLIPENRRICYLRI